MTPRTDALIESLRECDADNQAAWRCEEFARSLERELHASQERLREAGAMFCEYFNSHECGGYCAICSQARLYIAALEAK